MAAKDELGRRGEDVAAGVLERAGLVVLDRNWRCSEGELDIVATDPSTTDPVVIFCEVKTRSGQGYGSPFEAVTQGKRRKLRRLGLLWLAQPHIRGFPAHAVRRHRCAVATGRGANGRTPAGGFLNRAPSERLLGPTGRSVFPSPRDRASVTGGAGDLRRRFNHLSTVTGSVPAWDTT